MPSGEFLKILFAETTERTEIFRRVFDTNIFNRITISLNNKQKEAKEKLQELRVAFATLSASLNIDEEIDYKDINELSIKQILEKLEEEIDKNKSDYSEADSQVKAIEKDHKKFEDEIKEKINIKLDADKIKKSIEKLEKILKDFSEEELRSKKYSENLKIIKENIKYYSEYKNNDLIYKNKISKIKEVIAFQKEYEKYVKDYNSNESEYKLATNDYLEKEDEFFREQAGILALKLEEGKPCPVCGSTSHPNPASTSKSVLSKEQLDDLKKSLEKKRKALSIIKEKVTELNSKVTTLIGELEIEQDINQEKNQIESAMRENQEKYEEKYTIINNAYKEISGKKIDLEKFNFENYQEEVNSKVLKIKDEITKNKALKEEKEKEYEAKIKLIDMIDFEKLQEELKSRKKELDEKRNTSLKYKMILENNKKCFNKLENISKKLFIAIKEFNILDELYKTASGNLSGKQKINFEQFIQTNYFDMVIQEANKRLVKMTDGRFQLLRKESSFKISDKIALELEVLDYYNGKRRDVKSLSGGEAFKATLCLALGLSDIIQSYSGGVKVDTLFIDEGFGSLDAESREQAINTLNQLAGGDKLIGIISHVSELKERIERKIVIEKGINGSKIKIEQ